MNRKFFTDISASTVQVVLNQVLGLVVFFILSRFLGKEDYGEFNWSLAVLTFITSILSLRLEQIVVRRVAASDDPRKLLTLFSAHIFITGIGFYLLLFLGSFLFPAFFSQHSWLLWLAISHLLSFFSSPFKQVANGKEYFRVLAIMSTVANLLRAIGLVIILIFFQLDIQQVILLYIISSLIELLTSFLLTRHLLKIPFSKVYGLRDYIQLIRDSLPQAGVVFLNASIARIDWILLGLLATPAITAEYSFAYKVFELSPLPLLILAPILLSRFSKYFGQYPDGQLTQRKTELGMLIRFEMIAATSIPLILNMVWTPLVDSLTVNKYGAVNEKVFFLLSCCSPFLYINNLLWSVLFAQNKLTLILRITLFTFLILLIGDLVSIPLFAAQGAAFVYLLAIIAEYLNYLRYTGLYRLRETWLSPLLCMGAALVSGVPAFLLTDEHWIRLAISLPVYSFLLLATKQLCISDIRYIVGLVNLKKIEIT